MKITFFQTILKVMRGPSEKGTKCIFFSWSKCGFIKFDNQGAIKNMDWELNKKHGDNHNGNNDIQMQCKDPSKGHHLTVGYVDQTWKGTFIYQNETTPSKPP